MYSVALSHPFRSHIFDWAALSLTGCCRNEKVWCRMSHQHFGQLWCSVKIRSLGRNASPHHQRHVHLSDKMGQTQYRSLEGELTCNEPDHLFLIEALASKVGRVLIEGLMGFGYTRRVRTSCVHSATAVSDPWTIAIRKLSSVGLWALQH
jgi:hypothetical protein